MKPFREHHLIELLKEYTAHSLPLDCSIAAYFRKHKALGAKDRKEIADRAFGILRWKVLLEYLSGLSSERGEWEGLVDQYDKTDVQAIQKQNEIPPHIKVSFPAFLFQKISASYGEALGRELCFTSNSEAPTTIRVNTIKTTRDSLLKAWQEKYEVAPCQESVVGIVFLKKINFFELQEFKLGYFEIQDEASQLVALKIGAKPGLQIMDYCAGAGGKTLAFAPATLGAGQIYLHDVRKGALKEAKIRLRRAGIQNALIVEADAPILKQLKNKMDCCLVDVPCSGTGTLRRNPDIKWRLNEEKLNALIKEQRVIFEKALSFVKPEGKIVYATCSLLKEENEEQIAYFLKTYPLHLIETFQTLPRPGKMDGFFAAVMSNTIPRK